jgi:hypothetical protein
MPYLFAFNLSPLSVWYIDRDNDEVTLRFPKETKASPCLPYYDFNYLTAFDQQYVGYAAGAGSFLS